MHPKGEIDTSNVDSIVDVAISLNRSICANLDKYRHAVESSPYPPECFEDEDEDDDSLRRPFSIMSDFDNSHVFQSLEYYLTRPLFKAIAVVICGQDYSSCNTFMKDKIGQTPVLIILTGETVGLSAPITFEQLADKADIYYGEKVARTSLEAAIGFIMALEEREEAVFGQQPDPVTSTASVYGESFYGQSWENSAKKLGWGECEEPIFVGPSSGWVDTEKYPEWTGGGAIYHRGLEDSWVKSDLAAHLEYDPHGTMCITKRLAPLTARR